MTPHVRVHACVHEGAALPLAICQCAIPYRISNPARWEAAERVLVVCPFPRGSKLQYPPQRPGNHHL